MLNCINFVVIREWNNFSISVFVYPSFLRDLIISKHLFASHSLVLAWAEYLQPSCSVKLSTVRSSSYSMLRTDGASLDDSNLLWIVSVTFHVGYLSPVQKRVWDLFCFISHAPTNWFYRSTLISILKTNNKQIDTVPQAKILSLYVPNDLRWKFHIHEVIKKARTHLDCLQQ